jgi:hypothetical protein
MPIEKMLAYDYVYYCLCGALLGCVLVGIASSLLGFDPTHPREVGSVMGAMTVAVGFKLARWA